jgi:hypothetical protein
MKIKVKNLLTGREMMMSKQTFDLLPDTIGYDGKKYPNYGYVILKEKVAPEPAAAKEARQSKKPKKRATKTKKNENAKGKK